MTDAQERHRPDEEPDTEDLEEPSTEKDPGEQPKAPDDTEPDHTAIGIGVLPDRRPDGDD